MRAVSTMPFPDLPQIPCVDPDEDDNCRYDEAGHHAKSRWEAAPKYDTDIERQGNKSQSDHDEVPPMVEAVLSFNASINLAGGYGKLAWIQPSHGQALQSSTLRIGYPMHSCLFQESEHQGILSSIHDIALQRGLAYPEAVIVGYK